RAGAASARTRRSSSASWSIAVCARSARRSRQLASRCWARRVTLRRTERASARARSRLSRPWPVRPPTSVLTLLGARRTSRAASATVRRGRSAPSRSSSLCAAGSGSSGQALRTACRAVRRTALIAASRSAASGPGAPGAPREAGPVGAAPAGRAERSFTELTISLGTRGPSLSVMHLARWSWSGAAGALQRGLGGAAGLAARHVLLVHEAGAAQRRDAGGEREQRHGRGEHDDQAVVERLGYQLGEELLPGQRGDVARGQVGQHPGRAEQRLHG